MTSVILSPSQCQKLHTPYVLEASAIAISNPANTSENTLATIAIPAGGVGPNGFLRVWLLWSSNNNANSKTLRAKLGSTTVFQIASTTALSNQDMFIVCNRNAQNSQVMLPLGAIGIGPGNGAILTSAVDTSLVQNLTITGQLANAADTLALEAYQVELYYGA